MKNAWIIFYCHACKEHWPVTYRELTMNTPDNDESLCPSCNRKGIRDPEHSGSYPIEATHV